LAGWQCRSAAPARASLVFLHGVADNRGSVAGPVERFLGEGSDVVAYDSRAHGGSTGEVCTYGYWEKEDLEKVLDTLRPGPIVLLGTFSRQRELTERCAMAACLSRTSRCDGRTPGGESMRG
jgi:uncharacterized protein